MQNLGGQQIFYYIFGLTLFCQYLCEIATNLHSVKTSRKWLTVAIFRKWKDSSVALWIEIEVILAWMTGMETITEGGVMTGMDDWHG